MEDLDRSHQLNLVDVFTRSPFEGTPAAVVHDREEGTDDRFRTVAREFSDRPTAVLTTAEDGTHRLRMWHRNQAVPRSDRATIAAVATANWADTGSYTMEDGEGPVGVEVDPDGRCWVAQPEGEFNYIDLEYERVADAIGVPTAAVDSFQDQLALGVTGTRVPLLMVPVTFLEHVSGADPQTDAVETLCREYGAEGLFVFSFDTLHGSTIHGRCFPSDDRPGDAFQIPAGAGLESIATGAEAGAAACYLLEAGAFESDPVPARTDNETDAPTLGDGVPDELSVELGHFVDRPARISVRTGTGIQIGGAATVAMAASIEIPSGESDDIRVA